MSDFIYTSVVGQIITSGIALTTDSQFTFITLGQATISGESSYIMGFVYLPSGSIDLSSSIPKVISILYYPAPERSPVEYIETNYVEMLKKSSPVKGKTVNIDYTGSLVDIIFESSSRKRLKSKRTNLSRVKSS